MNKLGTKYGGWYIPNNINLNSDSIIYSVGIGEDISFDIILNSKYDCNIFLIDPTKKAINHFEEVKKYYYNNILFTGNIQNDYYSKIEKYKPNLNKFFYLDIGLWNKKDVLKFYKQTNKNYVSQSLIENMFDMDYDIVNVDTIKNIMIKYNHTHIDLLKLDIEGAEVNVLNDMLDNNILPNYLCIEYDLLLKNKDKNNLTKKLMKRLENNYIILIDDNLNITYKKKK